MNSSYSQTLPKTRRGGILTKSLYEDSFTLIPKTNTSQENHRMISLINMDKTRQEKNKGIQIGKEDDIILYIKNPKEIH